MLEFEDQVQLVVTAQHDDPALKAFESNQPAGATSVEQLTDDEPVFKSLLVRADVLADIIQLIADPTLEKDLFAVEQKDVNQK